MSSTVLIAGIVLVANYLGVFDSALNAVIDIHKKIELVLPQRAAPIPKIPYVVVPKPKSQKTTQNIPTKAP